MTKDSAGQGPVERELGPLPKPRWDDGNWYPPSDDAFDAEQMRAYALQEVAVERARCAAWAASAHERNPDALPIDVAEDIHAGLHVRA